MHSIKENIQNVLGRMQAAVERSGYAAGSVALVAVTKNVGIDAIKEAFAAGITDIGENRVQEALGKHSLLSPLFPHIKWHMLGHLQTNKVGPAVRIFDLIHSVDSVYLAQEIGRQAKKTGKIQEILIQVNISREENKFGVDEGRLKQVIEDVAKIENVKIRGLMTIAPQNTDERGLRPIFRKIKEISAIITSAKISGVSMQYLSMGMSGDFETAIEEGANLVRIGTAIFGERNI